MRRKSSEPTERRESDSGEKKLPTKLKENNKANGDERVRERKRERVNGG